MANQVPRKENSLEGGSHEERAQIRADGGEDLPSTKRSEVISVGLRAGSGEILGVRLAVRAKAQDALTDSADQVARGPAKLRDLAAEALIGVARDHLLSFLDRGFHFAGVEGIDRRVDRPMTARTLLGGTCALLFN